MKLNHFVGGTIAAAAIALVSSGTVVANTRVVDATPSQMLRENHKLPQLVVSEAFDIAGSETRAVSFGIVDGILQPNPLATFTTDTTIATAPGGLFYNSQGFFGITVDTIDLSTDKTLRRLEFGPLHTNNAATAMTLDREGRLYLAFAIGDNCCTNAIAVFSRNARGHVHPIGYLKLDGKEPAFGLAAHNDALYVSRSEFGGAGDQIEVYAPLADPKLVGTITALNNPLGITFDSFGELYICNAGDGDVLAIPAHQRGPVRPDRTITNANHSLCVPNPNPFTFNAGGLAVLGTHLFVEADASNDIVELDARRGGIQNPRVRVRLGAGPSYPWTAVDIAVSAP